MYIPVGDIHSDWGTSITVPTDAFFYTGGSGYKVTFTYPNKKSASFSNKDFYCLIPKGTKVTLNNTGTGSTSYGYYEAEVIEGGGD